MSYKIIGLILLVISLGFTAVWVLVNLYAKADLGILPPENITATRMDCIKQGIEKYAKVNGKTPNRLSDLPASDSHSININDAWGNEIVLAVQGEVVTLTSFGKDKKPGGVGENLDVIGIFEVRPPSSLNGWQTPWKVKPLAGK